MASDSCVLPFTQRPHTFPACKSKIGSACKEQALPVCKAEGGLASVQVQARASAQMLALVLALLAFITIAIAGAIIASHTSCAIVVVAP